MLVSWQREPVETHQASQGLGLKPVRCYFCPILLTKASHGAKPKVKEREKSTLFHVETMAGVVERGEELWSLI